MAQYAVMEATSAASENTRFTIVSGSMRVSLSVTAQLRRSPLACNPVFVVPLPHNEIRGSDGRFFWARRFEYMF
jgi:hypothetical protein